MPRATRTTLTEQHHRVADGARETTTRSSVEQPDRLVVGAAARRRGRCRRRRTSGGIGLGHVGHTASKSDRRRGCARRSTADTLPHRHRHVHDDSVTVPATVRLVPPKRFDADYYRRFYGRRPGARPPAIGQLATGAVFVSPVVAAADALGPRRRRRQGLLGRLVGRAPPAGPLPRHRRQHLRLPAATATSSPTWPRGNRRAATTSSSARACCSTSSDRAARRGRSTCSAGRAPACCSSRCRPWPTATR